MATVDESIEVNVPMRTAHDQWTQFEDFPQFMEGVESVQQLDDTHLLWAAEIGGRRHEWRAEITEQIPDRRIGWRSTDGKPNSGTVSFEPIDETTTRVGVHLEFETEGMTESLGSAIGSDSRRVKGDLERFRDSIEARGVESGAWRGSVQHGSTRTPG